MINHSADAGKMACRHEPRDLIVATTNHCKHCRLPIKAFACTACDGWGLTETENSKCPTCRGTGIDRWEAVT